MKLSPLPNMCLKILRKIFAEIGVRTNNFQTLDNDRDGERRYAMLHSPLGMVLVILLGAIFMTLSGMCKYAENEADWEYFKAKAKAKKHRIKSKVKVKARKVVLKIEQKSARGKAKLRRAAYGIRHLRKRKTLE